MKAPMIKGAASELADPGSATWKSVAAETVSLGAVPLAAQPTAYIREAWANRAYGTTASANVAAASDGERLYVRIEWADDAKANGEFPDAAAAVFPTGAGSALATMGSATSPVGLWYWEQGRGEALNLTSRGPGVVRKDGEGMVAGSAGSANGRWSVVLSGPASAAAGGKLGVAVWNGTNEERAGLGAVSQGWLGLEQA